MDQDQNTCSKPLPSPRNTEPVIGSIVQDIPDYWNCQPEPFRGHGRDIHRNNETQIVDACTHRSGLHVSWLHYCTLGLLIFCMGLVLTLWTAIALHRSDSMTFISNYASPAQLAPGNAMRPEYDCKPSAVIARARTHCITTTIEVVQTVTVKASAIPTFMSLTTALDASSNSMSMSTIVEQVASPTSANTESISPPAAITSITTETSVSTLTPSAKRIRPTTRYFS